ncbi:hypothetical protein Trydic_g19971 [Trypoxylus dichotomus]
MLTEAERTQADTLNNENYSIRGGGVITQFVIISTKSKITDNVKGSAKGFETIFTHSPVETEKKKPDSTAQHREDRLNIERQHIQWSEDWKKVVFMDEKRFSLDVPDGFQHYWHDLRKEPRVISRRPQDGGGAMVIFYSGAVEIIFIQGSLNGQKYLEIIENVKGVIQNQMGMEDFVLQQDNARVV